MSSKLIVILISFLAVISNSATLLKTANDLPTKTMPTATCKLETFLANPIQQKVYRLFSIGDIEKKLIKTTSYQNEQFVNGVLVKRFTQEYLLIGNKKLVVTSTDSGSKHGISFYSDSHEQVVLSLKNKCSLSFLGYLLKNGENRFHFKIENDTCKTYFSILLYSFSKYSLTEYDNGIM